MEKIDHIAIVVTNINHAVNWYTNNRDCKVNYQDESWAELQFENIKLALVLPQYHPPHIAFEDDSQLLYIIFLFDLNIIFYFKEIILHFVSP